MSERSAAPRPGGRAERPRTGDGERGRRMSEAGEGTGARGVRQSATNAGSTRSSADTRRGQSDTRRSGMRSGKGKPVTGAPVEGTAALALDVPGEAPGMPDARPRLWVAPPLPIRAPRVTFAASVIVVVLAGVLGILLINTKTMEQSFRLDALQKERAGLDTQQQELERQLIQVSGPGNLSAMARQQGLVPGTPAMIRLPDGKIVRPPKPGKGTVGPVAQPNLSTVTPSASASTAAGQAETGQAATGQAATGQAGTGQAGTGQASAPAAAGQ